MKRKILGIVLAFSLVFSLTAPAAALTGESKRAADMLATLGLVNGTPSGYALENAATIEQGAALLVRLLGETDAAAAETRWCGWLDVPSWAKRDVNHCAYRGLIRADEYSPNAPLTAEQWCAMLLRAAGFDDQNGDFTLSGAVNTARRVGLLAQNLSDTLTRGVMFETAANALTYARTVESKTMIARLVETAACSPAAANALGLLDRELSAREIADRYMSAGLCLELYYDEDAIAKGESSSSASAFFITEDGIAVTNFHSIDDAIYATGTLVTGEIAEVEEVLYYDRGIDIAVIRLACKDIDGNPLPAFRTLELVGTKDARVGDEIYTIGNPLGLGLALSSGVISATERMVELSTNPCIICDATISQGSSGGALMNIYGQVLGVTTGAYAKGNNMYIAVAADPVMDLELDRLEGFTLPQFVKEVDEAIKAEEKEAHNIVG